MTAHEIDNITSLFPESLSEAQISEINKQSHPNQHKESDENLVVVFQGKVLFLDILRLTFTREAEIVTLTRNDCQLTSEFVYKFQNTA